MSERSYNVKGKHIFDPARVSGSALVSGSAEVSGSAHVFESARVSGSAVVYDFARVFGSAQVSDFARVSGSARVFGSAEVSGSAWVSDSAVVSNSARVFGSAQVFGSAVIQSGKYHSMSCLQPHYNLPDGFRIGMPIRCQQCGCDGEYLLLFAHIEDGQVTLQHTGNINLLTVPHKEAVKMVGGR